MTPLDDAGEHAATDGAAATATREGPSGDGRTEIAPPPARRVPWRAIGRRVLEWVGVLALAALIALVLRSYVVQTFYVPSGSMEPTLRVGDRILVDKLPVVSRSIHRGDIIVFRRVPADTDPTHPADLVKRVIGLPGETISSRGDTVFINGRPIAEPWLPNLAKVARKWDCPQRAYDIPTTHIARNHYFVMGDCRGNSYDSRAWGTVPASYIVGKVFAVIWRHGHPWLHWF